MMGSNYHPLPMEAASAGKGVAGGGGGHPHPLRHFAGRRAGQSLRAGPGTGENKAAGPLAMPAGP